MNKDESSGPSGPSSRKRPGRHYAYKTVVAPNSKKDSSARQTKGCRAEISKD
jgi:hypothetical protein